MSALLFFFPLKEKEDNSNFQNKGLKKCHGYFLLRANCQLKIRLKYNKNQADYSWE